MSDYSLIRLWSCNDTIYDHICRLPPDDRYLRFGNFISDELIKSYIDKSLSTVNTESVADFWYGMFDNEKLIATIHIAIRNGVAEFALTTDIDYRGQKLGQLLFARGYQLISEWKIDRIYMCCLSKNAAIRHIAKKFGLSIMTYGTDSEASVQISYPVPLSRVNEVKMAAIDKGIVFQL